MVKPMDKDLLVLPNNSKMVRVRSMYLVYLANNMGSF